MRQVKVYDAGSSGLSVLEICEQTGLSRGAVTTAISRTGIQPSGFKIAPSKRSVYVYRVEDILTLSFMKEPTTTRLPDNQLKRPRCNRGAYGTTRGRPKK